MTREAELEREMFRMIGIVRTWQMWQNGEVGLGNLVNVSNEAIEAAHVALGGRPASYAADNKPKLVR